MAKSLPLRRAGLCALRPEELCQWAIGQTALPVLKAIRLSAELSEEEKAMDEPRLDDITQRLERLERENRWWKRLGSIVMPALGLILVSMSLLSYASPSMSLGKLERGSERELRTLKQDGSPIPKVASENKQVEADIATLETALEKADYRRALQLAQKLLPSRHMPTVSHVFETLDAKRQEFLEAGAAIRASGALEDAIEYYRGMDNLFPTHPEVREALTQVQTELARPWTRKAEEAERTQRKATALYYWQRASTVAADIPNFYQKIAELKRLLAEKTAKRFGVMFSENIPSKDRDEIKKALVNAIGATGSLSEIQGVHDLTELEIVTEIALTEYSLQEAGRDTPESKWSQFIAGYRNDPNPEYAQALTKYQTELADYQRITASMMYEQNQAVRGLLGS